MGLGAETVVAIGALSNRLDVGAIVGALALLVPLGLWYVWPLALRARLRAAARRG